MTTADGRVLAATKVVDNGPDSKRWNLTILGDGYRQQDLALFATHVSNFVTHLKNTPPFKGMWSAINIHRVDVISTDAGADDPNICNGPRPPTGKVAATYFDATFCSIGPGNVRIQRLLTVSQSTARKVAIDKVPQTHQILVIVNTPIYGGAGGQIAVCSADTFAADVAIHEIGHSFASLADEYDGDGVGSPSGEPSDANITRERSRARIKWRGFIAAETPIPTACQCAGCAAGPGVAASNAIGIFEGGGYSKCGIFRPAANCKMREIGKPFCAVCQEVIADKLAPYAPANIA